MARKMTKAENMATATSETKAKHTEGSALLLPAPPSSKPRAGHDRAPLARRARPGRTSGA